MTKELELPRGTERKRKEEAPRARWMTDDELNAYAYSSGSILLGKNGDRLIGSDDDRHVLTVAGSRAGKSSTCLKPNLMHWPSSVLCIDPKGELAKETAKRRAEMGQDVFILDPFGEVDGEAARYRVGYNPLSEVKGGDDGDVIDDVAMIADALIVPNKGETGDHWTLAGKNLLRGLMLYMLSLEAGGGNPPSLPLLRKFLTLPLEADKSETDDAEPTITLSAIFGRMMRSGAFSGTVSGVGGTMKGKPEGERGSIISTAVEQTAFLDSEPMRTHLAQNGGLQSLRQLKQKPTTIYLVLPASRMATHFRWLRVILTLALAAMEREPMRLKHPVLFVLEEFPQLGYMRQVEAAAGLMAGYGVKLWTVLQDLSQLKALYRDSWETFIGNAGVVQAFGNTDTTTLEYISRSLGTIQMTEARPTYATASNMGAGGAAEKESSRDTPLLAPFEVALYCERSTQKQIIVFAGKPPAYIRRLSHTEVQDIAH